MKVVLTDSSFPTDFERDWAAGHGHEFISVHCKTAQEVIAVVGDADCILTQFAPLNASTIPAMRKARAIVRYGIGVDNIDLDAARAAGIPVSNVPDYCIDEVADHTLSFMLSLVRGTFGGAQSLKQGKWELGWPRELMKSLGQVKVGIIGFGRIGRAVATRVRAFKAPVLAYDPVTPAAAITDAGCTPATLDQLFSQCDLITLHCPSTAETRKIINRQNLARTKKGVILVNVGRGDLVDQDALLEALGSGQIGAAGLDVMTPEPLPAEHPLRSNPRVLLSAHVASVSEAAGHALHVGVTKTADAALSGKLPPNIVNGVKTPRTV